KKGHRKHQSQTSRCSRQGRHHSFSRFNALPAGPAAELCRSAVEGKVFFLARWPTCSRVESWGIVGCISTRLINGKLWFVASYLGPGPSGTYRPSDPGPRLIEAVKATAGASMGEQLDLGFAIHWGDELDYKYECLLEITAANVAALLKSEFTWDDAA